SSEAPFTLTQIIPLRTRLNKRLCYTSDPMMTTNLSGKTALITGASKGLGKAMALALAKAGARLVLVSRNLEQLNQTSAAARETGTEAIALQVDVTVEEQVLKLEQDVAK